MLNFRKYIIVSFIMTVLNLSAVSLWDDALGRVYSNNISYKQGDTIIVVVNEESVISYKSEQSSFRTTNFSTSENDFSTIFELIPTGNADSSLNYKLGDILNMEMRIAGEIININGNTVQIKAEKTIGLNEKTAGIIVEGYADMRSIIAGTVLTSNLRSGRIMITTISQNNTNFVNNTDIIENILNNDNTGDIMRTVSLSEDRKKELLLRFINNILNMIY